MSLFQVTTCDGDLINWVCYLCEVIAGYLKKTQRVQTLNILLLHWATEALLCFGFDSHVFSVTQSSIFPSSPKLPPLNWTPSVSIVDSSSEITACFTVVLFWVINHLQVHIFYCIVHDLLSCLLVEKHVCEYSTLIYYIDIRKNSLLWYWFQHISSCLVFFRFTWSST